MKEIGIIGSGGHAKEVYLWATRAGFCPIHFYDETLDGEFILKIDDQFVRSSNKLVLDLPYVVGIGDPKIRYKVLKSLNQVILSEPIADPSAVVGNSVTIGKGSIVAAGAILTRNIKIGVASTINVGATISHDCIIGDYFNASPGVHIAGNVTIGDFVDIGIGSSCREKIKIGNNVKVGMGSAIVKDLLEEGLYYGVPARKIEGSRQ